ncbi:acyltransferase [Methanocorpusculum bavaricum]|uniref:acyltransferase n=1 Tax=Methanocorpusculum bavaricum TaxID=71518 RepID=UPI001B7F9848|nr:acyltransferase [Methanocorpusculum bavaricum]
MMSNFYSQNELNELGLELFGSNVMISKKSSIYSPELIQIGNNVRIDDFCILSGHIQIHDNIHISAYTALYGKFGIELCDFTTVSGRNIIYSATDDYSGSCMTNPMVPEEYTHVTGGKVTLKKHSIIGAGCIVLPNITLEEGTAIGAMSLVNRSTDPWGIYVGIPIRKIKDRKQNLLYLENDYYTTKLRKQ